MLHISRSARPPGTVAAPCCSSCSFAASARTTCRGWWPWSCHGGRRRWRRGIPGVSWVAMDGEAGVGVRKAWVPQTIGFGGFLNVGTCLKLWVFPLVIGNVDQFCRLFWGGLWFERPEVGETSLEDWASCFGASL